jgi:uncharacterized membrane protein SirB2
MSAEIAAAPVEVKESSQGADLKKRVVGLIAGGSMTVLVSAVVWVMAAVLPSKTDGPFTFLENICNWLYQTPVSVGIRESTLLFPVIEGVHLLGIALSVGMLCWFDLRLLGLVMKGEPVSKVWTRVMPTAITGFVLMFITGALLFWAEAATAYHSVHFWIKMGLIVLAGLNAGYFELTTHTHVAEWDTAAVLPIQARMAGLFSLLLWTAVIITGRTMAYSF